MQLPFEPDSPWPALGPACPDPTPPLAAAVAAIVAVAALRAHATGELGALQDAVVAALEAADPPAAEPWDNGLPAIADADPRLEAARLGQLMRRLGAA